MNDDKVRKEIGTWTGWDLDEELLVDVIAVLRAKLRTVPKEDRDEAKFSVNLGESYNSIDLYYRRLPTAEELLKDKELAAKRAATTEVRERAELVRLKEKYHE